MEFQLPDLEDDIVEELCESMRESLDDIEYKLEALCDQPESHDLINALFRQLHNVKGNCRMCFLDPLTDYMHSIESVFEQIREDRFSVTVAIKEATLIALDKFRFYINQLRHEHIIDTSELEQIGELFSQMANYQKLDPDNVAKELIDQIVGFTGGSKKSTPNIAIPISDKTPITDLEYPLKTDLQFFQSFAFAIDKRIPHWEGRTQRMLSIGNALVKQMSVDIDIQQLHAAIYMHDLGMLLMPESLINSNASLSEQERLLLTKHIDSPYQLLGRDVQWREAARIVLHHHERVDGTGYPQALTDTQICLGAKILAVLDTFCSLTMPRADRSKKRSVYRALLEINNHCGTQFDERVVQALGEVSRTLYGRD